MKLNNFLDLNAQAGDLHIDVRDYSQHGGVLMKAYHIGLGATKDRFPELNHGKERWKAICKPINTREAGREFMQIIKKPIPKELLEMEVHSFSMHRVRSLNNGLVELYQMNIALEGVPEAIERLDKAEEKEKFKEDLDENGQLLGQISFEEWSEENE